MELKINSIVVLDDQSRYILLNKLTKDNHNYFLTMGVDKEKNIIPDIVAILEENIVNGEIFVSKVEDYNLIVELTRLFKNQ